jgi:hypothetical protein
MECDSFLDDFKCFLSTAKSGQMIGEFAEGFCKVWKEKNGGVLGRLPKECNGFMD